MNFESAIAFVKSHGDEIEQARLAYLLANERPSRQVVNALLSGQREDGSWPPFWAPDYSSVDATCFRLAQAEQLGLTGSELAIARAVECLRRRQRVDGSWEEEWSVAAMAPPWAKPGNLATRLYLTANGGFWLAVLDDSSDGASRAAAHLEAFLDEEGQLPSFPHTHWLAGGLWHCVNRRELSERVLSYLDTQLANLPASNLAWMIVALRSAGVPASHSLVTKAASFLERGQGQDGHWSSEDGPPRDVHSTLEAMRALRLCGR